MSELRQGTLRISKQAMQGSLRIAKQRGKFNLVETIRSEPDGGYSGYIFLNAGVQKTMQKPEYLKIHETK